jgi:peptide/nickel transport system permease protein
VIRFVIQRGLWAIFVFLVATIVVYVIFYAIPQNPPLLAAGTGVALTPEFVAHVRHELHLDLPLYQQYWLFLWNLVRHGSLGHTFSSGEGLGYSFPAGTAVRSIIAHDGPVTASLVVGGAVIWLALSIPLGILSALHPRSLGDRLAMIFVLVGVSAHPVWIGLILSYFVGYKLGWTPIAGYCQLAPSHAIDVPCSGPAQWAYHMILPWLTFMLYFVALYVRMIRATTMETMSEDYVRTARAKGAPARRVMLHHVLRNSMLPVATMLGMDLALAVGVAVFTEKVFGLPGIGADLVAAATNDDLPVVVGIVLCVSVAVIVFNFLVDVAYAMLDPRIRLTDGGRFKAQSPSA